MSKPQLWPIFICYRRADGFATARRLHRILDKYETNEANGEPIILDAYGYLLSGDGRYGNPAVATVASVIASRAYVPYRLYFVNRDGGERYEEDARVEHGKKLDTFFKEERAYAPLYERVFRSNERGSLVIDLLDPVRY